MTRHKPDSFNGPGVPREFNVYGFDVETETLSPKNPDAEMLCFALIGPLFRGKGAQEGMCLPVGHPEAEWKDHVTPKKVLRDVLRRPETVLVCHNAAFDVAHIEEYIGGKIRCQVFCTLVASALLDETDRNDLGSVAEKYLSARQLGKGKLQGVDRRRIREAPLDDVIKYNTQDALLAGKLYKPLRKALVERGLWPMMMQRMRLLRVLINMHATGVRLDKKHLREEADKARAEMSELHAQLFLTAHGKGHEDLNPNAPQQIAALLRDLGAHWPDKTPTGKPKADAAVLLRLSEDPLVPDVARSFCGDLLSYRKLAKLIGTYFEPYEGDQQGTDGRVHTFYHLGKGKSESVERGGDKNWTFGTVTWRLSSSRPNLQNVASDPRVKGCFIASPGHRLLDADYSQVELATGGAWMARDPLFIDAYARGQDLHTSTLARIEGMGYEEALHLVDTEPAWAKRRKIAKAVNFSIMYGAWPKTIHARLKAQGVHATIEEVKDIHTRWRWTYKGYMAWQNAVRRLVEEQGTITSPLGVTRHFFNGQTREIELDGHILEFEELNHLEKDRILRQGVNFLVQNFAAELMYLALLRLSKHSQFRLMLTVHDSVLLEYNPRIIRKREAVDLVRHTMVDLVKKDMTKLGVAGIEHLPLSVDIAAGHRRWV
jgi:DNA polymerase-1